MTITADDLGIADKELARRVLAQALTIAPCLLSLDAESRDLALAVLRSVAAEAAGRGNRHVVSQSVGTARVSYGSASSWFSDDDRAALRALCPGASVASSGHPVGSFPRPARVLKAVWPEEE